jgi:mRNA-degrading endonuclease RelE of RelBE toxin-antitoxin system
MSELVIFTKRAEKDLRRLTEQHQISMVIALEQYVLTGSGDIKPLQGYDRVFRLRNGDYRACFVIVGTQPLVIEVMLIEKRGQAYSKRSKKRLRL